MYDYWMIIVGGLLGLAGIRGLITGSTTIYYQARRGWGGHKPLFTYQGRGLAVIMTIAGGAMAGLYFISRGTTVQIPPIWANRYAAIVFASAIVLGLLVCTSQGIGLRREKRGAAPKKIQGVSLADAATFLKLPESELLQMAQNGGIQAHYRNGTYVFHPAVLQSFQESMERLK